ncbi:hypothetical protein [Kitasatospora terrestris]|uniref:Tetratricopeptide repeat protein n=1 Tax=Kitasatospora terrestris TaxID=258051 RepID=A0ABP9ESF4_9ACTN
MADTQDRRGSSEAARLCREGAALYESLRERPDDLDLLLRSITILQQGVRVCVPQDPIRPVLLMDLGRAVWTLYGVTEGTQELALVTQLVTEAVRTMADDHPSADLVLLTAVELLRMVFERNPDRKVLDDAIGAARRVLRRTASPDTRRKRRAADLAGLLDLAGEQLNDRTVYPELVDLRRELLESAPPGHADRPARLAALATTLRTQYDRTGVVAALEAAVPVDRELAEAVRGSAGDRPAYYLAMAAINTQDLYRATGERRLLVETVPTWREAVAVAPAGPIRKQLQGELADVLGELGGTAADPGLLREGVQVCRDALASGSDVATLRRLGDALSAVGDREAIDHYRAALRMRGEPLELARCESGLSQLLLAGGELVEAVTSARRAAAGFAGHAGQEVAYGRLSAALAALAQAQDDPVLMAEATAAARAAAAGPPGEHGRAQDLHALGQQLFQHHKMTGERPLIEEAVALGRKTVQEDAGVDPRTAAVHRAGLGRSLHLLARLDQDDVQLDEATELLRDAIAATPPDDPLLPQFQAELALVLAATADNAPAAEQRVRAAVAAARDAARDGEVRGQVALGLALTHLFRLTLDTSVADEAAETFTRALGGDGSGATGRPEGDRDRAVLLGGLGELLQHRYRHTEDLDDLDRAVDAYTEARTIGPLSSRRQLHLALGLLELYAQRHLVSGSAEDSDLMLEEARTAAEVATDPEAAAFLRSAVASLLQLRNARTGDQLDLDTAVELCADMLEDTSVPERAKHRAHAQLCYLLRFRYRRTARLADLDEAVAHGYEALRHGNADPEKLGRWQSDLSAALRERHESTAIRADLDEAIRYGRLAAETSSDFAGVSHLGSALLSRYETLGQPDDLHRAVRLARDVVGLTESEDRGTALSNLGATLARRHESLGTQEDLDEAITCIRAAVDATSPAHQDRPSRLLNLAMALRRRHTLNGDDGDLTEAWTAAAEALERSPAGHPSRARALDVLGQIKARQAGDLGDDGDPAALDAAIELGMQAREAARDHAGLGQMVINLVSLLQDRYRFSGAPEDLEMSVLLCRQGLEHRGHAEVLLRVALGRALAERFALTRDPADAEEAVESWRAGATDPTGQAEARLAAAVDWAEFATEAGDPSSLEAYKAAVLLQRIAVSLGASRTDRERRLARWHGLAGEAAATAVSAGRFDTAVELLEQGRGVLWAQLLDLRTDLDAVEERAPELARQLVAARDRLDLYPM